MKKLEQMLAAMRPQLRGYAMGGSVANEPQQWTSQQKSLMGNRGQQKKGYNDIINDYHTPAGSAYRFTNPSAPIPFDAEKRFKQNVNQQQKVMEEQLINTEKAGEQKAHNMVDQFQLKVLENQQRGIMPNQELMEKWNTELRNENQRQPYTGRYKQADERLQHNEYASYPPQQRRLLNTQKLLSDRESERKQIEMQKQLLNVDSQNKDLIGQTNKMLGALQTSGIPTVNEQGQPLSLDNVLQEYRQYQSTLGENATKQAERERAYETQLDEARRREEERERVFQTQLGERVPRTLYEADLAKERANYGTLQNQYNATAQEKTQMEQQLATLQQQMSQAKSSEQYDKLEARFDQLLFGTQHIFRDSGISPDVATHYTGIPAWGPGWKLTPPDYYAEPPFTKENGGSWSKGRERTYKTLLWGDKPS